ncbi:Catalase-related peroxidase [Methylovirgula sp. HY1]|nr:catalase family peroxidase [Methylovirgula sp. HY1]QXX75686.1 Catalase-related peroxidase [Methylovirgula sp. HY1]
MLRTKHLAMAASIIWLAGVNICQAEDQPVEVQIVNVLNKLFGVHPGFRANHAKGVVVEGHFKASPEAAKLSKAIIFNGKTIPVTVRFSDSGGLPSIPDGSPKASPHGIAIKYHLADGGDTDMVLNSLAFFPVATGADFRDLLLAIAASPADAPKPTKFEAFAKNHPSVPAALATVATPDSFADEHYFGIDAFVFTDKAGEKQAVRYIVAPEKLVHLTAAEAAKKPANFLMDELPQRLAHGPVTFHLEAQLAAPADQTKDPSKPWPADRRVVDLGVLTIDKAVPDSMAAQKKLLFLPGQLVDGIEKSDDPLIDVRDGAYAVSFSRRNP